MRPIQIAALFLVALFAACGNTAGTEPTPEASVPPEQGTAPATAAQQEKGTSVEVNGNGLQVESKAADVKLSTDSLKIDLK